MSCVGMSVATLEITQKMCLMCLNQIMTEEAFDVVVVGSCMTDLVR